MIDRWGISCGFPAPHVTPAINIAGALGRKDKALHISWGLDYESKLSELGRKKVLLYDLDDCIGWFVDGTSALLHLVRAQLKYKKAKYRKIGLFQFDDNQLKGPPSDVAHMGHLATISVLNDNDNKQLPLGGSSTERWDETTDKPARETSTSFKRETETIQKTKEVQTRFQQCVEEFYTVLELIFAHEADRDRRDGASVLSPRKLQGYDFSEIYEGGGALYAREPESHSPAHKWADLVRSVGALTLFGKGFGKLIRPSESNSACNQCFYNCDVPNGQNLLIACGDELRDILDRKYLDGIRWVDTTHWRDSDQRFGCSCPVDEKAVKPPAKLQLRFKKAPRIPPPNPTNWSACAAVIFKRNRVRWSGNDNGIEKGAKADSASLIEGESSSTSTSYLRVQSLSSQTELSGSSSNPSTSITPPTSASNPVSKENSAGISSRLDHALGSPWYHMSKPCVRTGRIQAITFQEPTPLIIRKKKTSTEGC